MSVPNHCVRPYDEQICRAWVHKKYEKSIREKFGRYVHLSFDVIYQWNDIHADTPRLRVVSGQIPCASFYYTEFLVEIQPHEIYDIGCGMNFFKNILPHVIGIDGHCDADVTDHFDNGFVAGHENAFEAALSIDALHFISLEDFIQRVIDFWRIIAPGGRGYLSMNAARMWDHTPGHVRNKIFHTASAHAHQVSEFVDQELDKLSIDFIVRENLIEQKWDECIDGNIRLVFQK